MKKAYYMGLTFRPYRYSQHEREDMMFKFEPPFDGEYEFARVCIWVSDSDGFRVPFGYESAIYPCDAAGEFIDYKSGFREILHTNVPKKPSFLEVLRLAGYEA